MAHMVKCVKLGRELPGLDEPPFDTPLGERIYENVSEQAWRAWLEHLKMLMNEYRLNPATKEGQEIILRQMEDYFFGPSQESQLPPGYTPEAR